MIYFIYQNNYCEASEINEQLASKVTYITKEEYDEYMAQQEKENNNGTEMPN